ncbi:TonB-dependent receptor [Xylophilus rhododendri]|uniref:TonB-dependent receptor n=1 Tax=Xylophilus rhododendri TaxID=2697032 RepID=A0A857JCG7_9BURK|nr:TonB-dependent receptor [Xylophilus rhododendri]
MAAPDAAFAQARSYAIPAGPLAAALTRFAQEAGVSIAVDSRRTANLQSPGLSGPHGVDEGFAELLKGSGLAVDKTPAGYRLVPAAATPGAEAAAPAAVAGSRNDPLQEVTISASRSNIEAAKAPQTVQVIDQAAIAGQLALSTNSSDALSNLIPSYTPSRGKMNGSGETLRGRTPLILIDGVPQSNPIRPTGREAHTIDFSMLDRIEVIQGANAINGLGATGGTINLITRRPEKGSFNQHVDVQTTMPTRKLDGETLSTKTSYRADGRLDQLDYLIGFSFEDQGLWRDARGRSIGVDNTQGDLMDSRTYDFLGKVGYWIDDNQRLGFSLNRYRIKSEASYTAVAGDRARGIPTTSIERTPPGTPPWNDVWTTSATYSHYDLAGMELQAMVFHQEFEALFGADNSATFQDTRIAPNGTLYDQSRATSSKTGSKLTLSKADLLDKRLKLTAGFDTLFDKGKQDLYTTGRTYVPNSEYRNFSLFTQAEYKLLDKLTLHGGIRKESADLEVDSYQSLARYNRVNVGGGKLNFDKTLYNIGLVFEPVQNLNLYTSYSEGFGMPDVGRVLRAINIPNQSIANLSSLAPIVTKSVEFGGRYKRGDWDFDASYFRSDSDYGSRVVRVGDAFLAAREKNRIEGLDASVGYRFSRAHQGKLSYSRTTGRYDSNDDGTLDTRLDGLNIAPDRLIGSWTSQWSDKLSSFVQVQHAFSRSFDEPEKNFRGYSLVDASMAYKLPKGTVRLAVANLFNKDYITYYSQSALVEPLRYFAGRGRTLTLGYSLDF